MQFSHFSLVALALAAVAAPAAAATVDRTNGTATGIRGLAFDGGLVDVDFVFDAPADVYATGFDLTETDPARALIDAINAALNAETALVDGVGPDESTVYIVGTDFSFGPSGQLVVQEAGFFNGAASEWIGFGTTTEGAADQPVAIARISDAVAPASPVPLPGALPLILAGLGALAVVRRRA